MKQTIGLVGRKVGMTRIFTDDGASVPVTVLDVANNRVTQIKTPDIDGYAAVQVTFGKRRASRVNKAAAGHLAKAGAEAGDFLKEFPVETDDAADVQGRRRRSASRFSRSARWSTCRARPKGRGFSGVIKRHNFCSNRATHGNSRSHNVPGSIAHGAGSRPRVSGQAHGRASTATSRAPCRRSRSFASMPARGCCWSRARFRVRMAATSSSRSRSKTPAQEGGLTWNSN